MNEQEVFSAALEKSPEDRVAFLDEVCADDPQLRLQVQDLLQLYGRADGRFERPAAEIVATALGATTEKPGDTIGPFKLLEKVGEGGMGAVYVAEQTEPVHRKVALKVIKPGMDSAQVVARFEAERQALAMMNHPNIAKVLDAGATESGRPYFVMELVKGVPATDYCDQHKLDVRQRVELFITICQAVHHAHQKGVIHRDIKPSNVLVELHDVRAVPKVIDFGVAKATNQRLTERTLHTGLTQMIGTPTYMSPEQAQLSGLDVDTRSDIYALGVLLYELLTGTTPFDSETLRVAGFDEMRRMIREDEPPRPSDRVTTLAAEALSTVSNRRQSEPHRFKRCLAGELDWIVMKALEKDRARRYESASSFASDVKRFLDDEPVVACPPSPGYKLRKFARRNKAAFTTVILVSLALLLGITGTSWQAIVASQSRKEANDQRNQAERQRDVAEENFRRAREAVDKYLTRVSEDQLLNAPGMQPLRKDLLELALKYYEEFIDDRADDPGLQAEFAAALHRVADIRFTLGTTPEAHKLHQQGLDIRLKLVEATPNDEELLHSLVESYIFVSYGQSTVSEAISRLEKAIEIAEPLRAAEHQATLANALFELGDAKVSQFKDEGGLAKMEDARKAYSRSIQILEHLRKNHPDQSPELLPRAYSRFAHWHTVMDRPEESEQFNLKALAIAEQLAAANPNDLAHQGSLASRYWNAGQYDKSVQVAEKLAKANPWVVGYQDFLADLYGSLANIRRGQTDKQQEAVEWAGKSVAIYARLAFDNPERKSYQGNLGVQQKTLGNCLLGAGRPAEAIKAFEAAIDSLTESGLLWGELFDAYFYLSSAQEQAGKLEESIASQKELLKVGRQIQEDSPNQLHFRTVQSANYRRLGRLFRKVGRFEEAFTAYQDAVATLEGEFVDGNTPDGTPQQVRSAKREWERSRQQAFRAETERLIGLTENDRSELIDKFYSNAERNDVWFLIGRGGWHRSHGEFDLALADFRAAQNQEPSDVAQRRIILLLLQQGHARAAIEELPDIDKLQTKTDFLRKASLIAYAGEETLYRQLCERMLERFAKSDDIDEIESTCKVCSLLPDIIDPSDVPLTPLENALNNDRASATYSCWKSIASAMVNYRAGDAREATKFIRDAKSRNKYANTPEARAIANVVLAMAEHQLGNPDLANVALRQAGELIDEHWRKMLDDEFGNAWRDWLVAETLRREATALLATDTP